MPGSPAGWVAAGLAAGLAAGSAGAALRWARRNLVLVQVDGPSMAPTLRDGEWVLARRAGPGQITSGQVALLAPTAEPGAVRPGDPGRLWLVKRLVATPGEPVPDDLAVLPALGGRRTVPPGHLLVLGDNPAQSYDSRQEGFIAQSRLRGVVIRGGHRARRRPASRGYRTPGAMVFRAGKAR